MPIVVITTIPKDNAKDLAKLILEERVCACVNIIEDVNSLFWWEGNIDEAKECMLIIKTKEASFPKLKTLITNNHPYSVPEIISFKIDNINEPYFEWINKEVRNF